MDYIWIEYIMKKTVNRFDEIEQIRRKKRRKVKTRRILAFLIITTVVALLTLLTITLMGESNYAKLKNTVSVYMSAVSRFPVNYKYSTPIKVDKLGKGFAVLTEETLEMYAQNGEVFSEIMHGMTSPDIVSNETKTLLFGRGSRELVVTNHSFVLNKWQTEKTIIDADMSEDGKVAVLTDSERYTSELVVYDSENFRKMFTWYESKGFPISVNLTPNGNRAVSVTTRLEGEKMVSSVTVIDIDSAKEVTNFLVEALPINIIVGQNEIFFVGVDKMLKYNFNGDLLGEYSFSNIPLITVANDQGNNFALLFGDNNMSAINYVVVLDSSLNQLSSIPNVGYVADVYIDRNGLHLLSLNTINEWSLSGKPNKITEIDFGGIKIFVDFDSFVFYSNRIEKY